LAEKADAAGKDERIAALNKTLGELRNRERLAFLLNQVHPGAQPLLEADEAFRNQFLASKDCTGFVMSVDIRRSTELMLKARNPELFTAFIGDLSRQLIQIVLESFGVFDKFTGDGILAFFPDFYSGPDAGYHALSASMRCHELFSSHYRRHRHAFISVLQDTGLGIGIDFGKLHLVQVAGALTVFGPPVVYACRLGGAPPGSTLVNQPAFETLSERYGLHFSFEETIQELKHEGATVVHRVRPNSNVYIAQTPEWFTAAPRAVGA
jgi:class 3 adenylate cyclase